MPSTPERKGPARRRPERAETSAGSEPVALPRSDLPRRYLTAGDLMICRTACEVTTVLGSCVAVTFFSAELGLGGICHAMLPEPRATEDAEEASGPERWKYVCFAVDELERCFESPGLPRSAVEVKLFGGARLQEGEWVAGRWGHVGAANVAVARALLEDAGFVVRAYDVGGTRGRKVVFNTRTGEVHVKLLKG